MASKRFEIDMGLNASDVARGADDAKRSLEKLEDALEDTSKGGARDLESIEDELKDVQRGADRAGDEIGKIGDRSKQSFDDVNGNIRGFKDEAVQNLSEVASSFTGDMEDMASGVQGLTGGLASALTPGIGIPVAIIGAIAASFAASWAAAAEESEQRISDMYSDFTESGRTFVSEDFIAKAIQDIQNDTGKWADAQQRVKDTGLEIGGILRAMAGDQNAIAAAHATYVAQRDTEIQKIRESGRSIEDQAAAVDAVNAKFGEQTEWIGQIQRDTGTAADKAAAYREAMGGAADNAGRVRDIVGQIQDRTITVGVRVNDAGFNSWWSRVQARAAEGIGVNMRPGQGRAWQ